MRGNALIKSKLFSSMFAKCFQYQDEIEGRENEIAKMSNLYGRDNTKWKINIITSCKFILFLWTRLKKWNRILNKRSSYLVSVLWLFYISLYIIFVLYIFTPINEIIIKYCIGYLILQTLYIFPNYIYSTQFFTFQCPTYKRTNWSTEYSMTQLGR